MFVSVSCVTESPDRELLCLFCASTLISSIKQVILSSPPSEGIPGEVKEGNKWLSEWVQCLRMRVDRDNCNHLSLQISSIFGSVLEENLVS